MHGFLNRDAPDKQGQGGKDRPVGPQQLNMLGLRSKASPFQYIAQPNSCPFRISDRPLLPLRSRNFRAEEGSTVTRTLYDCMKRHRFKRLQVRKREREALLDIPFHMQRLTLSFSDLKTFEAVTLHADVQCSGNGDRKS